MPPWIDYFKNNTKEFNKLKQLFEKAAYIKRNGKLVLMLNNTLSNEETKKYIEYGREFYNALAKVKEYDGMDLRDPIFQLHGNKYQINPAFDRMWQQYKSELESHNWMLFSLLCEYVQYRTELQNIIDLHYSAWKICNISNKSCIDYVAQIGKAIVTISHAKDKYIRLKAVEKLIMEYAPFIKFNKLTNEDKAALEWSN